MLTEPSVYHHGCLSHPRKTFRRLWCFPRWGAFCVLQDISLKLYTCIFPWSFIFYCITVAVLNAVSSQDRSMNKAKAVPRLQHSTFTIRWSRMCVNFVLKNLLESALTSIPSEYFQHLVESMSCLLWATYHLDSGCFKFLYIGVEIYNTT